MEITGFGGGLSEKEIIVDPSKNLGDLLESSNAAHKLHAMRKILAMMSKGTDVSHMFPYVVKNVGNKNLEVKKLVYTYLVHHAELAPELALLSINTFQKDLADSNAVIRALALRVLSSIRLKVIVQIVVLSIQKCLNDSSPYVKKAAAHAITKVYALDPEQRDTLIELISTLLADRNIICLGSAVGAFNTVCPERYDLVHPHFQKLCHTLIDMDEWSQVHVLTLLTRYGRANFVNPNRPEEENERLQENRGKAWDSDEEDAPPQPEKPEEEGNSYEDMDRLYEMDGDHRLMINAVTPLLNSNNNSVVMAVINLLIYLAPVAEAQRVGRTLVRILRGPFEVQAVVLTCIVTIVSRRPSVLSGQHLEFFVRGRDPPYIRRLKLEVLTHLADEMNIHHILREFNYYTQHDDQSFVASSVQAIGRCAAMIPQVADQCMARLMAFLSSPSPTVVAESVLVIRRLLQLYPGKFQECVGRLAYLLDRIELPKARAATVYIIGHSSDASTYGPDVLRKLAQGFHDEHSIVKLQALNLGVRMYFKERERTQAIFLYIIDMALLDISYDVRDRARLMRAALFQTEQLKEQGEKLFLSEKPMPKFTDPSAGRERFPLGELSHMLNRALIGTNPVPDFPLEMTDEMRAAKEARAIVEYRQPSLWEQQGGNSSDWSSGEWESGDEWESEEYGREDDDSQESGDFYGEGAAGALEDEDGFGSLEDTTEEDEEVESQADQQEDVPADQPAGPPVAFDQLFEEEEDDF